MTYKKMRSKLAKKLRKEGGASFALSFKLARAYYNNDDESFIALGGKVELNENYPDDWMYDWSYGNWSNS